MNPKREEGGDAVASYNIRVDKVPLPLSPSLSLSLSAAGQDDPLLPRIPVQIALERNGYTFKGLRYLYLNPGANSGLGHLKYFEITRLRLIHTLTLDSLSLSRWQVRDIVDLLSDTHPSISGTRTPKSDSKNSKPRPRHQEPKSKHPEPGI